MILFQRISPTLPIEFSSIGIGACIFAFITPDNLFPAEKGKKIRQIITFSPYVAQEEVAFFSQNTLIPFHLMCSL
jgi:hypothetical protein